MGSFFLPRRARRIVVPGPLRVFADGLRRDLAGQGYALDTVTDHVHRLADLSGWLAGRGLAAADLTEEAAGQVVAERRAAGYRTGTSARAFAPVLGYLRRAGAVPPPVPVAPVTEVDVLLADYQRYLEAERSLAASTVRHYLRYARAFLTGLAGPLDPALAGLSAGQVTGYVLERARRRGGAPQDLVVLPALRSMLRYLHVTGRTSMPLAGAVPAGRSWKPGLPRAASADDLRAVLAACDRQSAGGRRDYAIVLALTRLALRGGEVARPRLADVGWRSGELRIAGKGGRTDTLPLPADVGEAMADYLLHARPATTSPNLFVAVKAPFGALAVSSVTGVMWRACERAGVPRFGPHRVRHAAACGLLAAGAPMRCRGQPAVAASERCRFVVIVTGELRGRAAAVRLQHQFPLPGLAAGREAGGMSDDRGLRHCGGQDSPGPPEAGLPGLRPADAAVGARPRARRLRRGGHGGGAAGPGAVHRLRQH